MANIFAQHPFLKFITYHRPINLPDVGKGQHLPEVQEGQLAMEKNDQVKVCRGGPEENLISSQEIGRD